jgi:hypothetical protein
MELEISANHLGYPFIDEVTDLEILFYKSTQQVSKGPRQTTISLNL